MHFQACAVSTTKRRYFICRYGLPDSLCFCASLYITNNPMYAVANGFVHLNLNFLKCGSTVRAACVSCLLKILLAKSKIFVLQSINYVRGFEFQAEIFSALQLFSGIQSYRAHSAYIHCGHKYKTEAPLTRSKRSGIDAMMWVPGQRISLPEPINSKFHNGLET